MNFKIENKKDKLVLKLNLPKPTKNKLTLMTENRMVVSDQDAINYLKQNNIKFGSMLKSGRNDNLDPPYVSEWEFQKPKSKPSTRKKENIILDKEEKDVVLSKKQTKIQG